MRGIQTPVRNVRRRIFKEIAKFGYEQRNLQDLEDLPYEIVPGEVAKYRDSIYRRQLVLRMDILISTRKNVSNVDNVKRSVHMVRFMKENVLVQMPVGLEQSKQIMQEELRSIQINVFLVVCVW